MAHRGHVAALATAAALLAGCAGRPAAPTTNDGHRTLSVSTPTPAAPTSAGSASSPTVTHAPPAARSARTAASQRTMFEPTSIALKRGGHTGTVVRAPVRNGVLQLPKDADRVGWWPEGARAGAPFGTVLLAGHVDSLDTGIGFFAQLLDSKVGDEVTLSDGRHSRAYRVTSVRDLPKTDLVKATDVFSTSGPARLALVTCTGTFDERTHHYDENRVVLAAPVDET